MSHYEDNYGFGHVSRSAKASLSGGWSKSGTLTAGNAVKEVSMQAEFQQAGEYTVEFNLKYITPPADNLVVRTEALITWSVEGNFVTRRVNVVNGVSVTGIAQAVSVKVNDVTRLGVAIPSDYDILINVAPGARPSIQQPPTLIPRGDSGALVAGGGFVDFPIPTDAGVISVFVAIATNAAGTPIPDQGIQVSHVQGLLTLKIYDPRVGIWIPISPGATKITVVNNTAFGILVFPTFGIDG